MRKRVAVAIVVFLPAMAAMSGLMLASAGSYGAPAPPAVSCEPNGPALSIVANDNKYDKTCLAAPPGQALTIAFDNQDRGLPHNVSIYDKNNGDKALYTGEIIYGPTKTTYNVPAIPAGTYQFRCDPHSDFMFGTFVVK